MKGSKDLQNVKCILNLWAFSQEDDQTKVKKTSGLRGKWKISCFA